MMLNRSSYAVVRTVLSLTLAGGIVTQASESIAFDQIGAEAQKQYSGDSVSIKPTADGAQIKAGFQMLEAEVTHEGLWLTSKAETEERFRLVATTIGRGAPLAPNEVTLSTRGNVEVDEDVSRFIRPDLTEEYRVSVDGIRQDFLVPSSPTGKGDLTLRINVEGAQAEVASYGAKLTLNESGHELAYSKLHVTDAVGQVLVARIEIPAADQLRVVVEDANAVYPVRVDPVFSQVDWLQLNTSIPGVNGTVRAIAVTEFTNEIYLGGDFGFAGQTVADQVVKWNGFQWEALGEVEWNGTIRALAIWNGNLIAGGDFTEIINEQAGGFVMPMDHIASWDGFTWQPLGQGTDGIVHAIVVCDDQINPSFLCVGGDFTFANGVPDTSRIATWDGANWLPLGTGMDGSVRALACDDGTIYAGGSFSSAGGVTGSPHIARWDGTAWLAMGSGVDGAVNALASFAGNFSLDPILYVGGDFLNAGGNTAQHIARWDAVNGWLNLGTDPSTSFGPDVHVNGPVHALALFDTDSNNGPNIHVGGSFTDVSPGFTPANRFAMWDGNSWSNTSFDATLSGDVLALAVTQPENQGGKVYAGGAFMKANGVDVNYVFESVHFFLERNTLGSGLGNTVRAVAVNSFTNEVYIGGDFVIPGFGQNINHVARWQGSQWQPLAEGLDGPVHALTIHNSALYAGGSFDLSGSSGFINLNNIARWNEGQWEDLGTGVNGTVKTLASSGNDLYVGGDFTSAGGTPNINRVAKWDGALWSPLATGMNGQVNALVTNGSDLYAGGDFTTPATRIAQWNGTAWSALGTGMNQQVHALALSGSDLFAGGDFTTPGNHIAKWDGSAWSPLGVGVDGPVKALTVSYNNLFVGGEFTTAGAISSTNIAKWTGSSWVQFSNMDGPVLALAIKNSYEIFAGGDFLYTQEFESSDIKSSPYFALGFLAQPAIAVAQSSPFETIAIGTSGTEKTFTISNTGQETLNIGAITLTGANISEFELDLSGIAPAVAPGETTTFTVTFAASGVGSGTRTAVTQIPNNAIFNNPFDIGLSALALSTTDDEDTDGLNDWAEFQFAPLGFDWQASQPELVSNLFSNLGNAPTNVNDSGFYSLGQVQALNVGAPLLEQIGPGQFKLTIGVEKSTSLEPTSFSPFSLSAPGTTTSFVDGKLEFEFAAPDGAAFFQLRSE